MEDLAVEEEEGREGLVLGGGGDVSFHGEVGEEGLDFGGAPISAGWRLWWKRMKRRTQST